MIKITSYLLLSILFSAQNVIADNVFATAEEKKQWEGKLVFEKVDGRNFYQSLNLTSRLRDLLSAKDFARIAVQMVTSPIRIQDGWLLYSGCVPHSCGDKVNLALHIYFNSLAVGVMHFYPTEEQELHIYMQYVMEQHLPRSTSDFVFMRERG